VVVVNRGELLICHEGKGLKCVDQLIVKKDVLVILIAVNKQSYE
jgi:hypothetical protein